ncbi:hypothetical protein GWI34_29475, partial [Actinomadura sp. DSM 109109]|nr:hypothetical protein [Actinomadura lepetitiana]
MLGETIDLAALAPELPAASSAPVESALAVEAHFRPLLVELADRAAPQITALLTTP